MFARIHILIASNAPVAVVIRRGPSKAVCTVLWNLKSNKFKVGQWLKGRIYERRSHLSPDGQYMIYFAMNGRWQSETGGSWTAISKVPYLKAEVLYGKGDCWNGGGLFIDNRHYWLNDLYDSHHPMFGQSHTRLIRKHGAIESPYSNNECLGVYYPRLLAEGWAQSDELSSPHIQVFDKKWGSMVLRKFCHIGGKGKTTYWDSHALLDRSGRELNCPDWEWADIVGKNLAFAENGKLFLLKPPFSIKEEDAFSQAKMLYDFNPMKFEKLVAPY